jgi:hypothetical protein
MELETDKVPLRPWETSRIQSLSPRLIAPYLSSRHSLAIGSSQPFASYSPHLSLHHIGLFWGALIRSTSGYQFLECSLCNWSIPYTHETAFRPMSYLNESDSRIRCEPLINKRKCVRFFFVMHMFSSLPRIEF